MKEDQQWLERIFAMYRDPLAQTPTYQKILREGREEGKLEGLQQSVLKLVENRFPSLVTLARERIQRVSKPETIDYAFDALLVASDEDAARTLLDSLAT